MPNSPGYARSKGACPGARWLTPQRYEHCFVARDGNGRHRDLPLCKGLFMKRLIGCKDLIRRTASLGVPALAVILTYSDEIQWLNYFGCLRLKERWELPDRYWSVSV